MNLKFVKMHGNQNDFIVFQSENFSTRELSRIALNLCARRSSVGADGILVVEEEKNSSLDFRMRIFNSDGSEAEMCGNGARCIAKYAFDQKICGAKTSFSTIAGVMRAEILGDEVALDMGEIEISPVEGEFDGLPYMFMRVGVPHCVVFYDGDLNDRKKLFELGRKIRNDTSRWQNGTNVNFVQKIAGEIWAVTYERGVEELTDSCGTGCVAAAIAMYLKRCSPSPVKIKNSGGVNEIFLKRKNGAFDVILKGKVATAFTGETEI